MEFERVYLPMAWRRKNPATGDPRRHLARSHDDDRRLRVDPGGPGLAWHQEIEKREDLQERMRQLYVGLTRARRCCLTYAWDDLEPGRSIDDPARGPLEVLLAAALAAPDIKDAEEAPHTALAARFPGLAIAPGWIAASRAGWHARTGPLWTHCARTAHPIPAPSSPGSGNCNCSPRCAKDLSAPKQSTPGSTPAAAAIAASHGIRGGRC